MALALCGAVAPVALAQGGRCDRACLIGIANQYVEALAAKDPAKAGLADGVRYSENGQRLRVGDGLWNSMSGKGTYQLHVTDAVAGQIFKVGEGPAPRDRGCARAHALRYELELVENGMSDQIQWEDGK